MVTEFNGAGRGALAVEDINIGEAALEIPQSIIISEQHIYGSNMVLFLTRSTTFLCLFTFANN